MYDDEFEWDDAKAAANVARHGVSFQAARRAFRDPLGVERLDCRERYGEERYVLLAMAGTLLLHVTYTVRGDRYRIISARPVEPRERRRYHEGN
jgi:uncharacterized DUF497 family protein